MTAAERMAALLLAARAGGRLVDAASEPAPASLDEAYRVQDLVLKRARPGAWKAIPPRPGSAPAASPVPAACVLRSPASMPAPRMLLGVEAEIAFRLGAGLEPQEALAAIELCETRLSGWDSAPALWKLADFQSNAALIVGSGTASWKGIDFGAQQVEVVVNGARAAGAVGGHPAGDPSRLLPWLREHCAGRGGLRPGDIVTTGSWVGIVKVAPGDEIEARFAGIGACRLRLRMP